MNSVKNGKKKDIKIILLGILVGLVVCGAGIYGVVSSRIASHEYKNSTDIREVSAVVGYCREVVNKDKENFSFAIVCSSFFYHDSRQGPVQARTLARCSRNPNWSTEPIIDMQCKKTAFLHFL